MKFATKMLAAALALGLTSSEAQALSCDEIMNMVNVNVPTNIVVQTMRDSGDQFGTTEVQCLESQGAPGAVVAQAKRMSGAAEQAAEPAPAPTRDTRRGMEADDDIIGARGRRKSAYDDLPEDGERRSADPERIKLAIKQLKAKKPLTASLMLFEMLEDKTFPEHETKIHYYLARCLTELEMFHTAQYHYMKVVKKGTSNPYFNYALPKLVAIARYTGDDSELMRIVSKIPPDAYPRGAKNHMHYLMGVRYFDKDELARSRKYFGQVSSKSPLYLKSEYYRGVIYNEQGKLKSAVRSFRDVYRDEAPADLNAQDLDSMSKIKDLALLNVARIYYGIERFDESSKYYDLVSRDSIYWADSLFENAWANFMQNNLNETLGFVLTVNSPFFVKDTFIPEATVLRALTFFNLCEYNQVEKILIGFEKTHRPIHEEMKTFVRSYATKEGRKLSDQAWDTYFGDKRTEASLIPKSTFNDILRNQSLAGVVNHMDIMDKEEALIDAQKSRWRDSVGVYLKKVIEADRQRYKRRAGKLLLSEMAKTANHISDLLTQSEIIRFEVVDAQRVDYQYKARSMNLGDEFASLQIDFATSIDFIYWPFNGEFWDDELGYYHYAEQGSCK
jgi:tetratricopeptide (TPR) repeat protein